MPAKIVWNIAGFEELRRLPQLKALLMERAQKIADRAGRGIGALPGEGRTRSRASVVTIDGVGVGREHNGHVILKSIDAGR